jgi:hypothetical protein
MGGISFDATLWKIFGARGGWGKGGVGGGGGRVVLREIEWVGGGSGCEKLRRLRRTGAEGQQNDEHERVETKGATGGSKRTRDGQGQAKGSPLQM